MNKITKEYLESEIVKIEFQRGLGNFTHCYITVRNGFIFHGESSCLSAENFDETIGQDVAYENAFEKMWSHYGFLLKTQMGQDTPLGRMKVEKAELYSKIEKLAAFLDKPKPDFLNEEEWELMQEQLTHMSEYYNVLKVRVEIAEAKLNGTAKK